MRSIRVFDILDLLSSQVLSVLQFRALGHPLFPNLKTLDWHFTPVTGEFIPFIPLFLSARTTTIDFTFSGLDLHKATTASMIAAIPALCPNLRYVRLKGLARDSMIAAAVSELVTNTRQNTLEHFCVDSPLTEEACEVIYKHPDLCQLETVIDTPTALPTLALPNLTDIDIKYYHGHDWLQGFCGASLGKLAWVTISSESDSIGDVLAAFKSVALTTSIPATLSTFSFATERPWRPSYRSLLPFTQLKNLTIESSCKLGCSSTIDDDTVTDLARAMPQLEILELGDDPCETPTGITVNGLAALAHYCPHLSELRIHFQVASLDPPELPGLASTGGSTTSREDCALCSLCVGQIRVPAESMLTVTLTLHHIFPHLEYIEHFDSNMEWDKVLEGLDTSKELARRSSERCLFVVPRSITDNTSPRGYA